MMSGLLGKKIGMTRIFDDEGNMVPVTVVQAGPCYVIQVKTLERDGYEAMQIGFDPKKEKRTNKPLKGHFAKANVPPLRRLKEFPLPEDREVKPGDVLTVEMFSPGEKVKVSGTSKGRGFAGVVKRHGFGGGPKTHGQSDRWRAPGSIGQSSFPSRVFKGLRMAGHMGNARATVTGLTVVKVDPEKNLLFIKGAVPGARNSYVEIYKR
ncbi:MAG: 50S ribosomal protein L3 [Calditrichaeota bacterium]|nr:MAG: 50S ribosomal protein L3 [Calditrichota bacterium]